MSRIETRRVEVKRIGTVRIILEGNRFETIRHSGPCMYRSLPKDGCRDLFTRNTSADKQVPDGKMSLAGTCLTGSIESCVSPVDVNNETTRRDEGVNDHAYIRVLPRVIKVHAVQSSRDQKRRN